MSETPRLSLPLLSEAQDHPEVPVDSTFYAVDALLQGSVIARDVATPPGGEDEGDAYILADSGLTGAFVGHESQVAAFQGGGYRFYAPREGWSLFVVYDGDSFRFDGGSPGSWVQNTATIAVGVEGSPSFFSTTVREVLFDNCVVEDLGGGVVRVTPGTTSAAGPIELQVAMSDMTTALTAGAGKAYVRSPADFVLDDVRLSLDTASGGSGPVTVDVNVNGASILSTKVTIDDGEKTSVTAATPAVIGDPDVSSDDYITFDIDDEGSGAKGLIVTLIGTRT